MWKTEGKGPHTTLLCRWDDGGGGGGGEDDDDDDDDDDMDLKEIKLEGVDCNDLAHDIDKWWALVKIVIEFHSL